MKQNYQNLTGLSSKEDPAEILPDEQDNPENKEGDKNDPTRFGDWQVKGRAIDF